MNTMWVALEITALGMGLVFGAILLLWGLMTVLTAITAEKVKAPLADMSAVEAPEANRAMAPDLRAQAAAVAVAIALADQQTAGAQPLADSPTAIVSAWQLGMRSRQLYQKGPIRRPPKIG